MPSKTAFSLSAGDRLGPYQISGVLGAGGMGEVYRAHDPRLGRDVALKVLRRSPTDPEHVARFSREARAAGSLNHPNIVAVFDAGTEGGVPYVVSELLEGETLRARMDHGALPYRKSIEFAIQIAQALDAAHAKRIWHRDVKPANVFITENGRVKLLDFGIAKLSRTESSMDGHTSADDTSRTGEIRGTAGYMAPEQVEGGIIDHRADIFALGAVLYEMFTGEQPFQRRSTVETMAAVLHDDPPDPVALNPRLPHNAVAVVRRCLEKNKEERFQSARDLAFDLQQLRDATATQTAVGSARSLLRPRWWPVLVALAALSGWVALGMLMLQPQPEVTYEQLTFRRGRVGGARFASGGQAVVYSEAREGTALDVWRIDDLGDSPSPRSLGYPAGTDLLSARGGELALSMRRTFLLGERFVGRLAIVPIAGGSPREVAENIEDADWAPDGVHLAVARSTTGNPGGQIHIEFPIGTVLHRTDGSIRFLRVSPDGRRIAFLEERAARGVGGRVKVVDLNGVVTPLTDEWPTVRGLAWASEKEIWFTAGDARSNRALQAVTLDGKQRLILRAPGSLTLWDIASDGRVLLTRDEERTAVIGVPPGETAERDLSWSDNTGLAHLSADGRWLLLGDRFGMYLRKTDGAPPISLGLKNGFADDLSADGQHVLATTDSSQKLVIVPTQGATDPRPLEPHSIVRYGGARWLPDGRRVLFNGNETARGVRVYIQDVVAGGPPRPLTPEDVYLGAISPDGGRIAATRRDQPITLWPIAGGESNVVPGSEPGDRPVAWSADGRSLWIFRRGEIPARVYQLDVTTGRRHLWKTLIPPDSAGVYSIIEFQVTPTGHSYFYGYTRLLSQLYLVRGLK